MTDIVGAKAKRVLWAGFTRDVLAGANHNKKDVFSPFEQRGTKAQRLQSDSITNLE